MNLTEEQISSLPDFATVEAGRVVVDIDKAYPPILKVLGLDVDQYGVEVARRCVTLGLVEIVGPGLRLKLVSSDSKKPLAIRNLKENASYGPDSMNAGARDGVVFFEKLKSKLNR